MPKEIMKHTIKSYIENPMGKGSTAITNKKIILDDLNRRLQVMKESNSITTTVYYDDKKDEYYFHLIIPSESERKNTYDVVILFTPDEKDIKAETTLNNYIIKFFSNCPSFIYTFAYSFKSHGLFIDILSKKFEREVLRQEPVMRNPKEIISYEKSVYFAVKYIYDNTKYMTKVYINEVYKKFNLKDFLKIIRAEHQIKEEIAKENKRLRKEKEEKERLIAKAKRTTNKDIIKGIKKENGIGRISSNRSSVKKKSKITAKRSISQKKR